jgi:hypothetical protein
MTGNRKNGQKTAGRTSTGRFAAGNPGKPRGARHKATQAALALLEGEGEALARKAVEMALNGDVVALRLCLERLVPIRKDAVIQFDLPTLTNAKDAPAAAGAVLKALADGQITPADAESALKVIDGWKEAQRWLEGHQETEALFGDMLKPLQK